MMTRPERERVELLARDIYDMVFVMLDAEPDIDSMDAGKVATRIERAFIREMEKLLG